MGNGTHILAISQISTVAEQKAAHVRWWHLLSATLFQGITWPVARLMLEILLRPKVEGLEHLKAAHQRKLRDGVGVLFVMNHSNPLDFVFPFLNVTPLSTLFPLFFIAQKGSAYHKNSHIGWWRYLLSDALLGVAGAHPHHSGLRDYSKSLAHHVNLLKQGSSVCIFPEGKIRRVDKNYTVHGGAGFLAEVTGAVVVPVRITGVENMSVKEFFTRSRRATVTYGAPINAKNTLTPSDPVPERYQNAAARILDRVYKLRSTEPVV